MLGYAYSRGGLNKIDSDHFKWLPGSEQDREMGRHVLVRNETKQGRLHPVGSTPAHHEGGRFVPGRASLEAVSLCVSLSPTHFVLNSIILLIKNLT